ncbi:hypothetical protein K2X33_00400, partial [bacterium]|nr:hypothetical protein [bacterium]
MSNKRLVLSLFAVALITGCGKQGADSVRNADEVAVLAQSSFHKNEMAPGTARILAQVMPKDGGVIAGPPASGGSDTGSIPAPGTGGGTTGGGTTGGGTTGGTTGGNTSGGVTGDPA